MGRKLYQHILLTWHHDCSQGQVLPELQYLGSPARNGIHRGSEICYHHVCRFGTHLVDCGSCHCLHLARPRSWRRHPCRRCHAAADLPVCQEHRHRWYCHGRHHRCLEESQCHYGKFLTHQAGLWQQECRSLCSRSSHSSHSARHQHEDHCIGPHHRPAHHYPLLLSRRDA